MNITFDWLTVSWALLVCCIVLFWLWIRATRKLKRERQAR